MEAPWQRVALACGLISVPAIMPQALRSGKPRQSHANSRFSAKRNERLPRIRCHAVVGDHDEASAPTSRVNPALRPRACYCRRRSGHRGGLRLRGAGRRPRRRGHRCAHLSIGGWPRNPPRRHRAGLPKNAGESRTSALAGDRCAATKSRCAARTTRPTATAVSPLSCFSIRLRHFGAEPLLLAQGDALVSATVTDKDCAAGLAAAEAAARQAKRGIWADSSAIKNAESAGRYFGRDRAVYGGRGQGSVGSAGRGNDLSEFRTELDTGLCCDYFKAHDAGFRGRRNRA